MHTHHAQSLVPFSSEPLQWHWLAVPIIPGNDLVEVEEGHLPARAPAFTRIFFLKERKHVIHLKVKCSQTWL